MGKKRVHIAALAAVLFLFPGAPGEAAEQGGCVTAACHGDMGKGKHVHGPVGSGDCGVCHIPTGKRHPGEKGAFTPAESGARLCAMCHEKVVAGKFVHGPVASGDCLSCHDPHQSPYRKQLREFGASLCYTCHDGMERLANGGKFLHAPFQEGDCLACHHPHASDNPRMLTRPFPLQFYLPYKADNYLLCFGCHNRDIAFDRRSVTETAFRNGDQNLHYLHVNRMDKGRSCKACHDPHASGQDKLVKEKIPGFGSWEIPIRYTRTATGGTCVVGCHKPKAYDRNSPAENP